MATDRHANTKIGRSATGGSPFQLTIQGEWLDPESDSRSLGTWRLTAPANPTCHHTCKESCSSTGMKSVVRSRCSLRLGVFDALAVKHVPSLVAGHRTNFQAHHGGAACDQFGSSSFSLVCGNGAALSPIRCVLALTHFSVCDGSVPVSYHAVHEAPTRRACTQSISLSHGSLSLAQLCSL